MQKKDRSISMLRANLVVLFTGIPLAGLQVFLFLLLHKTDKLAVHWNVALFLILLMVSIGVHEFIHGLAWAYFGKLPFSKIQFGFQWKTAAPYTHLKEAVDIRAYRIGTWLPGVLLGVLPYLASLVTGDYGLLLFGLINTLAAGGDFLILWLLRNVAAGARVEDHPTKAGCYVFEEES